MADYSYFSSLTLHSHDRHEFHKKWRKNRCACCDYKSNIKVYIIQLYTSSYLEVPLLIGYKEKIGKAPSEREYLTVNEVKSLADVSTGSPATKQAFMSFLQACAIAIWQIYAGDIQKTESREVIHIPSMQKTQHPVIVPLGIQAKTGCQTGWNVILMIRYFPMCQHWVALTEL